VIASTLAMALDPVRLAERAGLRPDPWQRDVLRSTDRQTILLCSRQAGKSTVSAVLAVHEAVYRAASLVLVLSPSLRQSQELFRKVLDCYRALDRTVPAAAEAKLTLELDNASRIISLPGKESTLRGFSGVTLLLVDEASRVPDELYQAVRPMLAVSGGRIVLLSTPFGQRGFFHHEWTEGGPAWQRVRVPAEDVPRISAAWLAQERAQIPDLFFRSEYLCEFVSPLDSVFRHDDIHAALDPTIAPLFGVPA
jgi:hypothetical protein